MRFFLRAWKRPAFLLFCLVACLPAQELALLGGAMHASDPAQMSYAWQVDYRQNFHRNFAASIAYLNEGHVVGHHRDGTAWQAWGHLPLFQDRISVSPGLGYRWPR